MNGKYSINNGNGKKISVNFDGFDNAVAKFNQYAENLKNGNSYVSNMIADLRGNFSADTFVNIDETLSSLKENIEQIYNQIISLSNAVKKSKVFYENMYSQYGGTEQKNLFKEEVNKSYKTENDGYTIESNNNGSINVNGKTYYNGRFGEATGDSWISNAAANDTELRRLLGKYNEAYYGVKSHGDGYAKLGEDGRRTYVNNLENAEKELQKYLSDHGYPSLTTSSGNSSSNSTNSGTSSPGSTYSETSSSNNSSSSSNGTWNQEVANSWKPGTDGHSISGTNRSLNVDGTTYYNGFGSETGSSWISDAAANDTELRQYLNSYNSAYEGAKFVSDGWVNAGGSRQSYIDKLIAAEKNLQDYLSEHNYPSLRTK